MHADSNREKVCFSLSSFQQQTITLFCFICGEILKVASWQDTILHLAATLSLSRHAVRHNIHAPSLFVRRQTIDLMYSFTLLKFIGNLYTFFCICDCEIFLQKISSCTIKCAQFGPETLCSHLSHRHVPPCFNVPAAVPL